jgi:hypothetical protein
MTLSIDSLSRIFSDFLYRSSITRLICGVPATTRYWDLCYSLFTVYTTDLISLIESHSLSPHVRADDTQVYGPLRPTAVEAFSSKVSGCVGTIASWMKSNRLQLHADKTEALWCATGRYHAVTSYQPLQCRSTGYISNPSVVCS